MPLGDATTASNTTAYLLAGGLPCIGVKLVNKAGDTPAHIVFTKGSGDTANSVCKQVLASEPVDAYFKSKVTGDGTAGKMVVGSSKGIYKSAPKPEPSSS